MHEGGARTGGPLLGTVALCLVAILVGALLGRFVFIGSSGDAVAAGAPARDAGDLAAARAALVASPDDPTLLAGLAGAALAEARRTADPAYYAEAERAVERALAIAPDDLRALVTSGLLALARHDFAGALVLAQRARAIAPLAVDPLGVEVDALVELGRYDEAGPLADEMVARRPNVSSFARLSYVLELGGHPEAALEAMQQAVAATAGARTADAAYVLALLGDLQLQRGRIDAAASAYDRALAAQSDQPQARLGQARVKIASDDLAGAAEILQRLTDRVPLPDAVALHADVLAVSGDAAGAAEQRALVRAIEGLNRSRGGIVVDLELARFEADHARLPDGDPEAALAMARAAREARPTIYGDDVLAWALRQAGRPADALPHAEAAVRFDTADASLWWHLAAINADLGLLDAARAHLEEARRIGSPLPLVDRAEAMALAARLGVTALAT